MTLKRSFDMPAIRRLEIERYARALDVADTDDFRSFLVAWQWHNSNSKDAAGALVMSAKRMGRAITAVEAEQVIKEAYTVRKCRKADALGRYLRLTDETRTALQIRTIGSIDISKQQRARRRKEQKRALERARRRMQGAKPRTEYLAAKVTSRLQPWKSEGISRRTWYYRRKAAAQAPEQASTRWRDQRQQDQAAAPRTRLLCSIFAESTRPGGPFPAYQLAQVHGQGSKVDCPRTCATKGQG